jgi:acetyl-CoA synthetase
MPMIPEAAFAMLACTRIGAMHSVVFGGFSPTPCATGFSTPTAAP